MMQKGKYQGRHEAASSRSVQKRIHVNGRLTAMVIATVMLLALAIGGTVAWITASTGSITNTFTPSEVSCVVDENFDRVTGVKSNVNVENTSDIPVYIRVRLVTYRTNETTKHIGGVAEIPQFTPGSGWVKNGEYYYYTKPVAPNEKPAADLIASIRLTEYYQDADGGRQAMDVMAEAIQSMPERAVGEAWGVTISEGSVSAYTG